MILLSIAAVFVSTFLCIKLSTLRLTMAAFLCVLTAIALAVFMVNDMHFMVSEMALHNCNRDL